MAKTIKNIKYYEAVGRRKQAVARVRMHIVGKDKSVTVDGVKHKQGDIIVNNKPITEYFPALAQQNRYNKPFVLTNNVDRFVATIRLAGGGIKGQLEALMLGISRAVQLVDVEHHIVLKKEGLLTRDPRKRERRKVGTGGKARRAKQSPKR